MMKVCYLMNPYCTAGVRQHTNEVMTPVRLLQDLGCGERSYRDTGQPSVVIVEPPLVGFLIVIIEQVGLDELVQQRGHAA